MSGNLREPSIPHGVMEARLIRWGESSTAGRTITLELEPEGDRHPFRDYPSGKTHGQRFMVVFTPKGDDERPLPVPPTEPVNLRELPNTDAASKKKRWDELALSQQAAILCNDPEFQKWTGQKLGWHSCTEREAADYVRDGCCDMNSRSDLDKNPEYAERFHRMVTEFRVAVGRETEPR